MCFTCDASRAEDEPVVGPRPVTYTVTPVTVRSGPLPDMIVAPRIQTVRPSSRSPRASRTSQSPRPKPSPRHSGGSLPLRPLSSHTPPLTPLSTHHVSGPDLPYSLYRRRYSAVVVIEHQHSEPRIVNARPSSKPSSLRARESPRTSDRNLGSPVAVTSPGPSYDVGVRSSSPRRRLSQTRRVQVTDDNEGETPIRVVRYRSRSGQRRSSASSPRGSGSSLTRGEGRSPRASGHVSTGSVGSPLQHAATAPTSPITGVAPHRSPAAADLDATQRIVTSPAALAAGANVTVGVLSQRLVGDDTRSTRAVAGSTRGDAAEVLGSEEGSSGPAATATSRVHWEDSSQRLQRRATADSYDRLSPGYHARRRSSGAAFPTADGGGGTGAGSGTGLGLGVEEAMGPRTSNVSVRSTRSTRSARERVIIVDPETGRTRREYRR